LDIWDALSDSRLREEELLGTRGLEQAILRNGCARGEIENVGRIGVIPEVHLRGILYQRHGKVGVERQRRACAGCGALPDAPRAIGR